MSYLFVFSYDVLCQIVSMTRHNGGDNYILNLCASAKDLLSAVLAEAGGRLLNAFGDPIRVKVARHPLLTGKHCSIIDSVKE